MPILQMSKQSQRVTCPEEHCEGGVGLELPTSLLTLFASGCNNGA